jgi:hypothetical protein
MLPAMKWLFCILLVFSSVYVTAQTPAIRGLNSTLQAINNRNMLWPVEKLYLQLDKPYYTLGDTLRFKSYLLNADFLMPSTKSGLLYVELADASGKAVKRIMIQLAIGLGWAEIPLDEKDFPEGSYTLRAYTNWMLNFGEDYIFKKNIYLSALSGSTLIKTDFKLDSIAGKNKVQAKLRFTGLNKDPLRLKDMQLRVMNGKRTLIRDKAATGMYGDMDINFDLPDKVLAKNLSIRTRQIGKGADTATLTIPVVINRVENTDVQFMPEGGSIVAGITTKIGFKATGEDGNAKAISGKVYNSKQQEVASFASTHAGMGSFELTPQTGESYVAKVVLPGGLIKSYPLPLVNPSGTALRVSAKGSDSLEVILNISAPLLTAAASATYYLVAEARGITCYASVINFKDGVIKRTIAKSLFPTGVAHFTLLSADKSPLNERIVFVDHHDNLQLSVATNKTNYSTRDSMALNLQVTDKAGKPVQGVFSLAVTDNSQVRTDSVGDNIINNMLFTADLKGTVDNPGWYFENDSPERIAALDNLLLTQGWIGYDWKNIFDIKVPHPPFFAEPEFMIQGQVTNPFNKGVENAAIVLYLKTQMLGKDTVIKIDDAPTDKTGHFYFKGAHPIQIDSFKESYKLQVLRVGKGRATGITMENEFKPPVFGMPSKQQTPWYVNSDTVLLNNSSTKLAQQKAEANYRGEGTRLKEVAIKAKRTVKGSKNLNGPGEADLILDEQALLNAGKMTLGLLLEKNLRGFRSFGAKCPIPRCNIPTSYMLNGKFINLVIDGVNANKLYDGGNIGPLHDPERYAFLKFYMDYYSAEDITGIEVMYNGRYSSSYNAFNLAPMENFGMGPLMCYIEITTRTGAGPWLKTPPGIYWYRPMPFTNAKQFYRPRYTPKNSTAAAGLDMRSTIHWEPNIVTDSLGRAAISFFSADRPVDYTLTIEGTDLNGNFGYRRQKIGAIHKSFAAK